MGKSAEIRIFKSFTKIKEIMSYTREDALKLNDEKIKIEKEISECKSVLDSEADVGMNGPLIDNEGYPRNDIDIVKVRTARQKIICLMNDHKEIMKKIQRMSVPNPLPKSTWFQMGPLLMTLDLKLEI